GAGRAPDRCISHRAVPNVAATAHRHRHRALGGHPEHHLWHLGLVRIRAVPAGDLATVPDRDVRQYPRAVDAVRRPALRHWNADRGPPSPGPAANALEPDAAPP